MAEDEHDRSSPSNLDSSSLPLPPTTRKSVHQSLGGGAVADVLLWKKWKIGAFVLITTTTIWLFFEKGGYSLLSFAANVLLLLVTILFLWAKSASLLNRPLPPLPDLEISDAVIEKVTSGSVVWINRVLAVARDITLKGDVKLLSQVVFGLWVVSYIGGIFNFLTLIYFGEFLKRILCVEVVLLSLVVPPLYHKYQDHVDEKLTAANKVIATQYRKIDESILSKIKKAPVKEKKIQ